MNLEQARFNMIEQQIRPWEVLDPTILNLLNDLPREDFVPEGFRNLAYADIEIPLGHGQSMMPPRVEARALQALGVKASDLVYEIGTGSGWLTACLARLGRHVVSKELHQDLSDQAAKRLGSAGFQNVTLEVGDALAHTESEDRHDVIVATGSFPVMPQWLQGWLKIGGRLFVVTGEEPAMEAWLITRVGEKEWSSENLFETVLAPLENVPQPAKFVF